MELQIKNKMIRIYRNKSSIHLHQEKQLVNLINYNNKKFEMYRKKWVGLDLKKINLSTLSLLPIISKKDIQDEIDAKRMYVDIPSNVNIDYTTGSTGKPFKVIKDKNTFDIHKSDFIFGYGMAGYNLGDKLVRLWRGDMKKSLLTRLKEKITNKYAICIYDPKKPIESQLNNSRVQTIIEELNDLNPLFIDAFPSALIEIINFLQINDNVKLRLERLKGIFTGAEELTDIDRKKIEKTLQCKVYNRYGGTEFGGIAHECKYGEMHISEYKSIVEIINNQIIITDLYNKFLPLVRYNTNDTAEEIININCKCGIKSKVIRGIAGRKNDMIDGINGPISSHYWHNIIKKNEDCIENFQIIQEGNIYKVKIKIKKTINSSIKDSIQKVIPEPIDWEINEKVSIIKRNGKYSQSIKI